MAELAMGARVEVVVVVVVTVDVVVTGGLFVVVPVEAGEVVVVWDE